MRPFISASPKNTLSNLDYLTIKHTHGYHGPTTAKNSGQNWRSELPKIHSRILHGFFYVCKLRYVMTSCIEEPLGSPRSLGKWYANFIQPVTFQLALKVTVSQPKETVPCL